MFILTTKPWLYEPERLRGHSVYNAQFKPWTDVTAAATGLGKSYKELFDTRSGACLIVGMGPSRNLLHNYDIDIPTICINKAATEFRCDYWAIHDWDGVLAWHDKTMNKAPMLTYCYHVDKPDLPKLGREVFFYEIYSDPQLHRRKPIYWSETTLGCALDLAIRMGFRTIYTIGTDLTEGGYDNPYFKPEELKIEHRMVRRKIEHMFSAEELPKWKPADVRIIDLSGGHMPTEKASLDGVSGVRLKVTLGTADLPTPQNYKQ